MKIIEAPVSKNREKINFRREKELRDFVRRSAVLLREGKQKAYPAEAVMSEMRTIINKK